MTVTAGQISVEVVRTDAGGRAFRRITDVSSDSGLAHAPEWLAVIRNTYGHDPLYLRAEDSKGNAAVLPAFIVRRPFVGTAVTSMPFLDAGGPCGTSPALADALVERLIDEARGAGANIVDIRCTQRLRLAAQPMEHKVNMVLRLPADPASLWRRLDSSVRNQIRKAERAGLSVEFAGEEKLDEFYAVFARRMRELGSPVHARAFFAAIFQAFESKVRLVFVTRHGTPIGGLVALAFKETLVVPWASCLSEHFTLCPNMLLYWQTIRMACEEGFQHFDFGRSTRASGTYRFKRQWGADEAPLFWYSIPMTSHGCQTRSNGNGRGNGSGRAAACVTGIWRHLPLPVTKNLGPRIRKYLIQ